MKSIFSTLCIFSLGAIVTFLSIQVTSAHGGNSNLIHGCVKSNGDLRIISADGTCGNNESPLDWRRESQFPFTCPGCDLNADLVGNLFAEKNLAHAIVQDANLSGTNFQGFNLIGIYLKGAILDNTTWTGQDLSNYNFEGTHLSGADLQSLNLQASKLTNSYSESANMANSNLTGVNFSAATLLAANFLNANLTSANMNNANAGSAIFTNANITNANFTNANLGAAIDMTTATRNSVVWSNTTCPDLSNSNDNGNTCEGHLTP